MALFFSRPNSHFGEEWHIGEPIPEWIHSQRFITIHADGHELEALLSALQPSPSSQTKTEVITTMNELNSEVTLLLGNGIVTPATLTKRHVDGTVTLTTPHRYVTDDGETNEFHAELTTIYRPIPVKPQLAASPEPSLGEAKGATA